MNKYNEIDIGLTFLNPGSKSYTHGECIILLSPPYQNYGWHMTISCKDRNPTWEEIKEAWYSLIPNAENTTGAMFFPPLEEYINLHQHCFHIHQVNKNMKINLNLLASS
jgi:hypothetical protein